MTSSPRGAQHRAASREGVTGVRGILGLAAAAFLVGACAGTAATTPTGASAGAATAAPGISLFVDNGTTLAVALDVNGRRVGAFAPSSGSSVDPSALPPPPWSVVASTASGRALATMDVSASVAAQVEACDRMLLATPVPAGGIGPCPIPMGRVDLSCGRLTIYAGDSAPSGPMPPSPAGSPGDCRP